MSKRSVLVIGATGQVGGAVARELLDIGHQVRALVRDPDGDKAQKLASSGAELTTGDLDDLAAVTAAAQGMDTVFALTTPMAGVAKEVEHGKTIVDATAAAGVDHLVFSSVASANKATGIPHFDSKWEIEEYLSQSGVSWTVTAPVFFYDNILFPWNAADIAGGNFRQALRGDRKLQQIPVRDIGRFNALVIDRNDEFVGRRIDIASDELTSAEAAEAMAEALDRPVTFHEQDLEEVRAQFEDMATMYQWFEDVGFDVDIDDLRASYPSVGWTRYSDWLSTNRELIVGEA